MMVSFYGTYLMFDFLDQKPQENNSVIENHGSVVRAIIASTIPTHDETKLSFVTSFVFIVSDILGVKS